MEDISKIDTQIRNIKFVDWLEVIRVDNIPDDAVVFWSNVAKYSIEDGSKPFCEISKYFLSLLSLPVSSAFVERCFSLVTYVKDKYANRMSTVTLDAVLRLKSTL